MKKKSSILVFSGVLLFIILTQQACTHSPDELAFAKNQKIYVIDKESSGVSVFTEKGVLEYSIGPPAAGTDTPGITSLPSEAALMNVQNVIRLLVFNNKGIINGLIWNDLNGNRFFDAGEQGVHDIRVFIDTNGDETYNPGEQSKHTDANGNFEIKGLRPVTHSVRIDNTTLPQGYVVITNHPLSVTTGKKTKHENADFGIQNRSASIDGYVWNDSDANGVLNNESPIPGMTIYVDLNNDNEYKPGEPVSTTDSNGYYRIQRLPAGEFKVYIDDVNNGNLPAVYHRTPISGANPTPVKLIQNQNTAVGFGYIKKASISGLVRDSNGQPWPSVRLFIDLNGNGVYDEGEPTTVSNQFGYYIFNELFPGTYTVMIQSNHFPSGYDIIASPNPITIGEGTGVTLKDFLTKAKPLTITGFVWNDENGNGRRDQDESGIAGATVFLDANNNGLPDTDEQSTVTDNSGTYSFSGLDHGDFYIRVDDTTLLNAYIATTPFNPVYKVLLPGKSYDGPQFEFGYRRKIAVAHDLEYPTRLSWGTDGKLYISDNTNGSVFIYDSDLNVQGELKGFSKPLGVTSDETGNIYVGNRGRKNVEVFDSSGNLLRSIGDGTIMTPNDIVLDRNTNIYILDSANNTVLIYNQSGTLVSTIGNALQLGYAVSMAIHYRDDGSGNETGELYIADQKKFAIHMFGLDGTYIRSIGKTGSMMTTNWDGKFSGLMAVDVDQNGNVHGLDNNLNVVQVFDPVNGSFLTSYPAYTAERSGLINVQTDLAIHPADNRVIVSNLKTRSVDLINTLP